MKHSKDLDRLFKFPVRIAYAEMRGSKKGMV